MEAKSNIEDLRIHRNISDISKNKGKKRNLVPEECTICLEPISERAIASPCNHLLFDFVCLTSWLKEHPTCPLCKQLVRVVEYDWRSPDDYKTFVVPQQPPPQSDAAASWIDNHRPRAGRRRRRPQPQPQLYPSSQSPSAMRRRRFVYEHKLYSLHTGSNSFSKYKEYTPAEFEKSSVLQSKARTWIRRELCVFDDLAAQGSSRCHGAARRVNDAEFILDYTLSVLGTVEIRSSTGTAQHLIGELLGQERACIFLHDLHAWLRSPYTQLQNWDRHVRYEIPLPFTADEVVMDPSSVPWGGFRSRDTDVFE